MYSEQSTYLQSFGQGWWAGKEEEHCPCHGYGWNLSELDTWHQCPVHYNGQPHPDEDELRMAAMEEWEEEWKTEAVVIDYGVWIGSEPQPTVIRDDPDDVPFQENVMAIAMIEKI